jgi:hypothetical protein
MRNSLDGHSLYTGTQATAAGMPTFRLQPQQHHHRPLDASEFTSPQLLNTNPEASLSNTKGQETPNMGFAHLQNPQYPATLFSQTGNSPPSSSFPSFMQRSPQLPLNAFSPTLGLSPSGFLAESLASATAPTPTPQYATFPFDTTLPQQTQHGIPNTGNVPVQTPGGHSQTSRGSQATISEGGGPGGSVSENDPFLSLLEQLAENENSQGGPSELDYFLSGAIDVSADAAVATTEEDPRHEVFARLEQDETKVVVELDGKGPSSSTLDEVS